MPPVQATIAITPGVGQFLDAVSLTVGANLVVRETMIIADPTSPTELAAVSGGALAVFLPTAQITTLTPPTASAIGTAVAGALTNPLPVSFSAAQHVIVDSGTITAVTSITNPVAVTGTFFQATQPVSIASGQVASGAFASGSIASGAIASGAIAAGAAAAGAFADGSVFVRSNAAATFPVTATIAAAQTIAVTNVGTFAVQATLAAETTKVIGTIRATGNVGGVMDTTLGSTAPANALQVGGYDGTNMQALAVDTAGVQKVRPAAPTTSLYTPTAITFSGSGANTIGPAASGSTTVRVYRMFIVNTSTTTSTNITIQDSTVTTFSGAFLLLPGGSLSLDGKGDPLYISAAGKAIQLNSSVAVQISGTIWTTQS